MTSTNRTNGELKVDRRERASKIFDADRLPPHSPEAEKGVLGCILLSPQEVMPKLLSLLKPGPAVFYDLRNRIIYSRILEMLDNGDPIDALTLYQSLKENSVMEKIGGINYLNEIQNQAPSAANAEYWAETVMEKFLLRTIISTGTRIVNRVYENQSSIDSLLDEIERDVLRIGNFRANHELQPIKVIVHQVMESIEAMGKLNGAISGIQTGFVDLDRVTDGMHEGDMIVISAFPSVGKTSLAMNIVEHMLLEQKLPTAFFSLEMTAVQLVTRFICSHARVNMRSVRDGFLSERDYPKIVGAAGQISNAAIYFDDTSDLSIYQLRARARRMKQQYGIKAVVIDYLQLLSAVGGSRKMESRQQEVSDISSGIKAMAKELRVPVIVLSQLNDDGKLRDSRTIGMDADGVWNLERCSGNSDEEGEIKDAEEIDLWVRKNRNGPRDVRIPLTFLACYTRFENAAKISDENA